jgi:hypothetical protein
MLDHALEAAFAAYLQSDPAFDGVFFSTGHDSEEHQFPSVTASSKSEPLGGSSEVFRSELSLLIESEAHDSSPDQHAALVEKVRTSLASRLDVLAAINAGSRVYLYGYSFADTNLDVDGIRFRTTLTLKAGYGVP